MQSSTSAVTAVLDEETAEGLSASTFTGELGSLETGEGAFDLAPVRFLRGIVDPLETGIDVVLRSAGKILEIFADLSKIQKIL